MRLVVALLLLSALSAAPEAAAQVRRCVDAQGNSVFTDRACAAVNATPKADPLPNAGAYASGFARQGCARSPGQLLDGVRNALDARDVNRLANYYHWTGTGSGAATHLMDRLEAIAARPLVNAQLIYPSRLPELDAAGFPTFPPDDPAASAASAPPAAYDPDLPASQATSPESPPRPDTLITNAPGPPPESLLVEQMSGVADVGSAQVRFQLRRHAGCWWIQL